ncbi:hypothetical protein B0O80DRAFT_446677 [Mortierella sp. GBAus27b]|nr:hypothetical protein BGX31_011282 [Mortierella sp. GBA43]KAI8357160.1 hypothetical protein B0O80DRAFT_446677 [Mortierella sp. GBAus27b]
MRRIHPQRAKAPGHQQDTTHVMKAVQGNPCKKWTTVSDIRNSTRNGNSTSGGNMGNCRTNSGQLYSLHSSGKSQLSKQSKLSFGDDHNNKPEDDISVLLHEDSDDDFEEPSGFGGPPLHHGARRHRLFEEADSRLASSNEDKPDAKRQRRPSLSEGESLLDDAWPLSSSSLDLDFSQDADSPRIHNATLPTYSGVSATQHALNEIDELLMEEDSVPLSPDHGANISAKIQESNSRKSFPEDTGSKTDTPAETPAPSMANEEHVQAEDRQGQESKDKIHPETSRETEVATSETTTTMERNGASDQEATKGQNQAQPTQVFDLPATIPEFKARLDELKAQFQLSMDGMMEAIWNVDSLAGFVKDALSRQQEYLDERGKYIQHQVQNLQKEATTLHSKATKGLD